MEKRVPIYGEDAVRVTANYKDFDGNISQWRDTFYELWRYQMTWSFAYEIEVIEGRDGVFVSILSKPDFEKNIVETMGALGYGNVKHYAEKVGVVESLDVGDYDTVVID